MDRHLLRVDARGPEGAREAVGVGVGVPAQPARPVLRGVARDPARTAVASALALDELARRENLTVSAEDVDKEIEKFAVRAGRTPAALRAQLEKEGGVARLAAGLRREKAVDLALTRATITSA